MKKILFVAFMALAFVGMTSCQKDEDLTGTKWVYTETETDTEVIEGVHIPMSLLLQELLNLPLRQQVYWIW